MRIYIHSRQLASSYTKCHRFVEFQRLIKIGSFSAIKQIAMTNIWVVFVFGLVIGKYCIIVNGFENLNQTEVLMIDEEESLYGISSWGAHMVPITFIHGAAAKAAVCLDGSLPAYHLDRGYGPGGNNWLVNLEGGGWCNDRRSCAYRKMTLRGSSYHMEKQIPFTGILSNRAEENPDFFNWNRVKIRYCDGASFAGDSEDKASQLHFRGQRIYWAAIEELMSKGMRFAKQALLSGCSAGGLATILHCDEFRNSFSSNVKVKCFADAGLFLDAVDVAGGRTLRNIFSGVVGLHRAKNNLPRTCTNHQDATSCFFPENLIGNIRTPLFLLNAAYDSWQVLSSLAPRSADHRGIWDNCKYNYGRCSASEIQFLQGFRNHMLNAVKGFAMSKQNGLFINSCFAHCQSERQDTWFTNNSPLIRHKGIAVAFGDWYFDRAGCKAVDCAYPCDRTCHNLVFRK